MITVGLILFTILNLSLSVHLMDKVGDLSEEVNILKEKVWEMYNGNWKD